MVEKRVWLINGTISGDNRKPAESEFEQISNYFPVANLNVFNRSINNCMSVKKELLPNVIVLRSFL